MDVEKLVNSAFDFLETAFEVMVGVSFVCFALCLGGLLLSIGALHTVAGGFCSRQRNVELPANPSQPTAISVTAIS